MRRVLPVAALALAATPAHAVEVTLGGHATGTFASDGGACFQLFMPGPFSGVATSTGVVTTRARFDEIRQAAMGGRPTDVVVNTRNFATLHDSTEVCLPGVGRVVQGGVIVFTVHAHGVGGDYAALLRCDYDAGTPDCR